MAKEEEKKSESMSANVVYDVGRALDQMRDAVNGYAQDINEINARLDTIEAYLQNQHQAVQQEHREQAQYSVPDPIVPQNPTMANASVGVEKKGLFGGLLR